jgi:hypothetical protein
MICKICGGGSGKLLSETILGKYQISYHRCQSCGFIQTEEPYWIEEAYSDAIADMDTGILERNSKFAQVVPKVIGAYFNPKARFVDYGAGYGIFVRLMRDRGFDFYWQDNYCDNLFAKRYRYDSLPAGEQKFELLTAFEVFEHLVDPKVELEKMLKLAPSVLFSTNLVPTNIDFDRQPEKLRNWWYLNPETGQHVAFYTLPALRKLGEQYRLNLYSNGYNFHLLTPKKLNPWIFSLLHWLKRAKDMVKGDEAGSGFRQDREAYKEEIGK